MKKLSLVVVLSFFVSITVFGVEYWRYGYSNSIIWPASGVNRVGIGTGLPEEELHIVGELLLPNNNWLRFEKTNGVNQGILQINSSNQVILRDAGVGINIQTYNSGWQESVKITNTGNVGIGTTSPSEKLHVIGNVKISDRLRTGNNADGTSWNVGITGPVIQRSGNVVLGIESGNVGIGTDEPFEKLHVDGKLRIGGLNGTTNYGLIIDPLDGYDVKFECTPPGTKAINFEVWDDLMMRIYNDGNPNGGSVTFPSGNVGIGTDNPQSKLTVNGTITAEEIEVQSEILPDFVFEDNYKLMSLNKLEKHIKKEKSLPGIPTSEEAVEEGVKLGDMQAKLLQKVEELTLYVIEQNKELTELKEENKELKHRISRLEK